MSRGCWPLAVGYWLWTAGCWLLAVGLTAVGLTAVGWRCAEQDSDEQRE
jgi:hypothetical protein